jgi:biotin operon repressor
MNRGDPNRFDPEILVARVSRWLADPEGEVSGSARFARRLAAGEALNPSAMAKSDRALVTYTVQVLRKVGAVVRSKRPVGYTLVSLPPSVSQNGNGKIVHSANGHTAVPEPQHLPPLPARAVAARHPMVGGHLQVRAVVLNDGALEVLAVDDDGHAWQLGIIGQT